VEGHRVEAQALHINPVASPPPCKLQAAARRIARKLAEAERQCRLSERAPCWPDE